MTKNCVNAIAGSCLLLGLSFQTVHLSAHSGVASAHRLDEYLQATLISIQRDHVEISMGLIPGIGVSAPVIASIDTNSDGVLSRAEGTAYAESVLKDLSLSIDGTSLEPKLLSVDLPPIQEIRDGLGEIHIAYRAELPSGGSVRKLFLETHNQMAETVYLVNALAPSDPAISITAQKRNRVQSVYELDYSQSGGSLEASSNRQWRRTLDDMKALGLPTVTLPLISPVCWCLSRNSEREAGRELPSLR